MENLLLDAGVWAEIEGSAGQAGPVYFGVDLGATAAQSAVAAYWPRTGRLEAVAAFPGEPPLAERGLRDGVGRLYVDCWQRGELLVLGGAAADAPGLIREAVSRFGRPKLVAADRYRDGELKDALDRAGVSRSVLRLRGMGFRDGAEDVREFRRACLEDRVTPVKSLLLRAAMSASRVATDPAGNAKLAKGTQGGRRLNARDDAAAAAILAVSLGARRETRKRPAFRYVGMAG